jgi:hypothetical protein
MAIMGIQGFEPTYLIGMNTIREAHGARLAALAGRRFTGFALVRFTDDARWFADCPVVLDFDGVQVEICHWGLNELSISWDGIDTSAALSGGWGRMKRELEWSRNEAQLEPFLGLTAHEVSLLEWRPAVAADTARGMVAVEFAFADGRFRIANGLDENAIEVADPQPGFVRVRLNP